MTSADNKEQEFEKSKVLINSLALEDGKLVSPIDLNLDNTRHLHLDRLKWMNFGNIPVKMKLTNTGETVIISGKWSKNRPYLCGGPLTGNYVFSQIHFHWGSDEHEGSEHTIRGISYPMEVHVVYFKTRYLTQEAALKENDGVMIVVYLVKLLERSTPALSWLTNHLQKVKEPQTSTPLPLSPLSALLVPFNMDYLLYWGLTVTQNCSHTMLWLISRVAFSITVDNLSMFRKLLSSRKEPMNKNFRGASPTQGRTILHINPSEEKKHVLLPGTVDPPDQTIIVNYTQMPPLDHALAQQIFNRGDNTGDEKETDLQAFSLKCVTSSSKTFTFCEGSQREESDSANKSVKYKKSTKMGLESYLSNRSNSRALRHWLLKEDILHRTKFQKRKYSLTRKNIERDHRLGIMNKTDVFMDMTLDKVMYNSFSNKSLNVGDHGCEETISDQNENKKKSFIQEIIKEKECPFDFSHDTRSYNMLNRNIQENAILDISFKNKMYLDNLHDRQSKQQEVMKESGKESKGKPNKSRLPIKTKLESSLAPYFSQSESNRCKTIKPEHPTITGSLKVNNGGRKPVATTIPRPIGKNAGKIEENCGINNTTYSQRRPLSSPTKFSQQRK